jgi:hypothetical protein
MFNAAAASRSAGGNGRYPAMAANSARVRMNAAASKPSVSQRWRSIFFSRVWVFLAGDWKMTLALAMNVSTLEKPSASKRCRRRSILTVWPPTLMARRKAK